MATTTTILRRGISGLRRMTTKIVGENSTSMHNQSLEELVDEHRTDESYGPIKLCPRLREQWLDDLSGQVEKVLREDFRLEADRDIRRDIEDFFRFLPSNPAREHAAGSTHDGLGLWLHLIARHIEPDTLVESGVWVGRSLYTLRQAEKAADLHAFDITFHNLLYDDPSITYHEHDWTESSVTADGTGMCYFDDHINHGKRIREAYEKGFRHLVFDDVARLGTTHMYRYPALPSALMIADGTLQEGDVIEWDWKNDSKLRYTFHEEDTWGAEDVIAFARPVPSLKDWMGESASQAAYVRLKE